MNPIAPPTSDLKAEIGHVLFIDIVGYSKLLINEQTELLEHLKGMVRGSEQVRAAEAQCALELSRAGKAHPELQLRTESAVRGSALSRNRRLTRLERMI